MTNGKDSLISWDESFIYVTADLDFSNKVGNTFTAFTSYRFSDLYLSMAFKKDG